MEVKEPEYYTMYTEGDNESETLNGSHHLIVEMIKSITRLDEEHYIITEFNMNIKYKKDPTEKESVMYLGSTEDGSEILIDTKNVEMIENYKNTTRQNLIKLLEEYVERGWMNQHQMNIAINEILQCLYLLYGKKVINTLLEVNRLEDATFDKVSTFDLSDLLDTLDLPYHIKTNSNYYRLWRKYES